MIRLSKDKVDERFNIDDNGTITDLEGNVQKTYLWCGTYPTFKNVPIHRIIMYTKNGYKNKVVHHKDGNKLNNNINNLQYLTRQEHMSLHKKGIPFSKEHKKKIGESNKGKRKGKHSPTYGKHWKKDPITGKRLYY